MSRPTLCSRPPGWPFSSKEMLGKRMRKKLPGMVITFHVRHHSVQSLQSDKNLQKKLDSPSGSKHPKRALQKSNSRKQQNSLPIMIVLLVLNPFHAAVALSAIVYCRVEVLLASGSRVAPASSAGCCLEPAPTDPLMVSPPAPAAPPSQLALSGFSSASLQLTYELMVVRGDSRCSMLPY